MALLGLASAGRHTAAEVHRAEGMIALAVEVAIVLKHLPPDNRVRLQEIDLLAQVRTMEIEAALAQARSRS